MMTKYVLILYRSNFSFFGTISKSNIGNLNIYTLNLKIYHTFFEFENWKKKEVSYYGTFYLILQLLV